MSQRFFKEHIKPYEVKTSIITKLAKKYFMEIKDYGKDFVFSLCEELLSSRVIEESFIVCKMSDYVGVYEERDFEILERWVDRYINNWATCDTRCNQTIGSFVEYYPRYVE